MLCKADAGFCLQIAAPVLTRGLRLTWVNAWADVPAPGAVARHPKQPAANAATLGSSQPLILQLALGCTVGRMESRTGEQHGGGQQWVGPSGPPFNHNAHACDALDPCTTPVRICAPTVFRQLAQHVLACRRALPDFRLSVQSCEIRTSYLVPAHGSQQFLCNMPPIALP